MSEEDTIQEEPCTIPESFHDIENAIRAGFPLIWVPSWEEDRLAKITGSFFDTIKNTEEDGSLWSMYVWDCIRGLRERTKNGKYIPVEVDSNEAANDLTDFITAVEYLSNLKRSYLAIMMDPHHILENQSTAVRALRNFWSNAIETVNKYYKSILISAPMANIPMELEKAVIVARLPLPSYNEIIEFINEKICNTNLDTTNVHEIASACKGLTISEIYDILTVSILEYNDLNIESIIKYKKGIISKTNVLDYYDESEQFDLDDIGGLEELKRWINRVKLTYTEDAKEFGLVTPKGMLLMGVPGCGKSMVTKAMAKVFKQPLIKLDIGKIMGSLVGSSEANIRRAIDIAESIAPCILVVEELEKAMSGSGSSNFSISGDEYINYITPDGKIHTITLKDLAINWANGVNTKIKVAAINPLTLDNMLSTVNKVIKHKLPSDEVMLEITTASGRTVKASGNHSFVVLGDDGNLVEKKAIELKINETCLPIWRGKLENNNESIYFMGINEFTIGELLGIYSIAGTKEVDLHGNSRLVLYNKNAQSEFTNIVESIADNYPDDTEIQRVFNIKGKTYKKPGINAMDFRLPELVDALDEMSLLSGSSLFVAGVMSGILKSMPITKKYSTKTWVAHAAKNEDIARFVNMYFVMHGDQAYVTKHRNTYYVMFQKYTSESVRGVNPSNSSSTVEDTKVFPISMGVGKELVLSCRNRRVDKTILQHALSFTYTGFVPSNFAAMLAAIDSNTKFAKIFNAPISWDIVTNIKVIPSENYVYDLEIEGTNTFSLSNGITVHNSDGGTTSRVLATFLQWMQDHEEPVFIAATANNVDQLPPELLRAGRFSKIIFVDLPNRRERKEIFKIHINRIMRRRVEENRIAADDYNLDLLAESSEGYSGAEIEQAIALALEIAFENQKKFPGLDMTTEDIVQSIRQTIPLSRSMKEKIDHMREWAKQRAIFASDPDDSQTTTTRSGRGLGSGRE